jgi:PKD repeat protein
MYKWDFNGDSIYDDSSAITSSMNYTYTRESSYTVIFYVRDDDGNDSTDVRVVTVQNSAPVITSIRADTTISMEYAWDCDGDGTFDYTSATQSNTGYRYTTIGTYNAVFRATDDDNKQSKDTVRIIVLQDIPVPDAGNDTTVSIYDTIRLHGSASDGFGHISKWEWDFGNTGTFITTSTSDTNILASASENSNYQCVLRVTDDDSNTAKDTVRIIVLQDVPVPNAGSDTTVRINSPVTLSGTVTQQFGIIVLYKWDFDGDGSYDDSSTSTPAMTYTYTHETSYNARFYVRDDDGNDSTDVRVVTVQNSSPVITSIRADTTISIQDSIQLTASAVDSDGTIIEYAWDCNGDGTFDYTSATQSNTGYCYTTIGTYNAIFRVTDDDNKQSLDTAVITVILDKPYVNLGNDTTVSINDTVRINGTVTDSFGTIVSIQWNIGGSGFVPASSPDTTFVAPSTENLNYLCIIRVVDDDDNLVFDTLVVRVETDPPTAVITAPDTARVDSFFTLSSSSSSPGNFGTLVKYEWSINAYNDFKETSGNDTTIFTDASEIDSFIVVLRVTDDDGNIDYDTTYIVICRIWEFIGQEGFSDGTAYAISLAIDGNDIPYVAYSDYSIGRRATVMKFNGLSWEHVGNKGFSDGESYAFSLAIDNANTPYVAYRDAVTGGKATVMKYNGSSWEAVGNKGFSDSSTYYVSLAIKPDNNTPYVAFREIIYGYNRVMKYNGASWEQVGNLEFGKANRIRNGESYISLAFDINNIPLIAYGDYSNEYKATVLQFNDPDWDTVGNYGFSDGGLSYIALAFDSYSTPYVAYQDKANDQKATVMKYNGATWEPVGNKGFSDGYINQISLVIDNNDVPCVLYNDGVNGNKATVMRYIGFIWEPAGRKGFSTGEVQYTTLAINSKNVIYVAFTDGSQLDRITVMRFR